MIAEEETIGLIIFTMISLVIIILWIAAGVKIQ